ncbi:MAG: hypothetical protein HS111_25145 [Kofleriaceae bacterium]|nr:hypothetical protein [Kofleriaceae bacterium]
MSIGGAAAGKSFAAWIELMHELVTELGVVCAILGRSQHDLAICDTWLMNLILDTPQGDVDLAGCAGSRSR